MNLLNSFPADNGSTITVQVELLTGDEWNILASDPECTVSVFIKTGDFWACVGPVNEMTVGTGYFLDHAEPIEELKHVQQLHPDSLHYAGSDSYWESNQELQFKISLASDETYKYIMFKSSEELLAYYLNIPLDLAALCQITEDTIPEMTTVVE